MKERIVEYLNGQDTDFVQFATTLSDRKADAFANAKVGRVQEFWFPRKYIAKVSGKACNIFYNIQEVDFTRFSWTFLKMYSEDKELHKLIEIIDDLNATVENRAFQFRLKKLRIYLFTSLNYVGSPYFNPVVYKKCMDSMYKAMERLNGYLEHKVKIISTTYDSVAYLGRVDLELLRKVVAPADFKLRTFKAYIHFRNLLGVEFADGGWTIKKTTGTRYDDTKEKVIGHLRELNFKAAIMELQHANIYTKMKVEYIKDIIKLQKCPRCQRSNIFADKNSQILNWRCNECGNTW